MAGVARSVKNIALIAVLVALTMLLMPYLSRITGYAIISISDCQDLGTSGNIYRLTGDINLPNDVQPGQTYCMNAIADNVTLDCDGHSLNGTEGSGYVAVQAVGRKNITIINCAITNYDTAVYFSLTNYSLIRNVSMSDADDRALWLTSSANNTITNVTITGSTNENVYSFRSSKNVFSLCKISSSFSSDGISLRTGSNYNLVYNCTLSTHSLNGLYVLTSNYNNITDSVIRSNTQDGLVFSSSNSSYVLRNNISANRIGILVGGNSNSITVGQNNIWSNSGDASGIEGLNNTALSSVSAENNYWGSQTGPGDPSAAGACVANLLGTGDNVTDDAVHQTDYCPWLTAWYETVSPRWSNNNPVNASGTAYAPSAVWKLNITWVDNGLVNETFFEWNGVNYTQPATIAKSSNFYTATLTDLAAGTYSYRWYANDTNDNWNSSSQFSFTVGKALNPVSMRLGNATGNYVNRNIFARSNETVNITAVAAVGAALWRNGTDWTANSRLNVSLAAGVWEFKVNATGNANYSDNSSLTYYVTVISVKLPLISSVSSSGIVENAATISWTTDENSNSTVNYGTAAALGSASSDSDLATSHAITLGSLLASTLYYYNVTSCNDIGCNSSATYNFTTAAAGTGDTTVTGGGGGGGGGSASLPFDGNTTEPIKTSAPTGGIVTPPKQSVCPSCPEPGRWSPCVNDDQTREAWVCNADTKWVCQKIEEKRACNIPGTENVPLAVGASLLVAIGIFGWYLKGKKTKKPAQHKVHHKPEPAPKPKKKAAPKTKKKIVKPVAPKAAAKLLPREQVKNVKVVVDFDIKNKK